MDEIANDLQYISKVLRGGIEVWSSGSTIRAVLKAELNILKIAGDLNIIKVHYYPNDKCFVFYSNSMVIVKTATDMIKAIKTL